MAKARFKSLEHELARRGGVKSPRQTAQAIGRAPQSEAYVDRSNIPAGRRRNPSR